MFLIFSCFLLQPKEGKIFSIYIRTHMNYFSLCHDGPHYPKKNFNLCGSLLLWKYPILQQKQKKNNTISIPILQYKISYSIHGIVMEMLKSPFYVEFKFIHMQETILVLVHKIYNGSQDTKLMTSVFCTICWSFGAQRAHNVKMTSS